MDAQFIETRDGTQIAYNVSGTGSNPLVLLHGFSNNRHIIWHDLGWVAALSAHFTVITLDLRGCGQSTQHTDPARYTLAATCEDVLAVADACGVERFCVFGFSFGATIALHLAARSERPRKIISAGTRFGQIFTADYVDNWLARIAQSPPADPGVMAILQARINTLRDWPGIEPVQLQCPALIYTGSQDANVELKVAQRDAIEAAGHQFAVQESLDHIGLVKAREQVLPLVLHFLEFPPPT